MKKLIKILPALLCTMTMTACQDYHKNGGIEDTASVKITLDNGGEIFAWDELTGGAIRFREWLSGFETELAESVPEGGLSYLIELTFGSSAPTDYRYVDCGNGESYLLSEGEWQTVKNPSPMPVGYTRELGVDVSDIVKVEHVHCAGITELTLSETEKAVLSEWLGGLKYEHRWFPEGEAPGDSDGGEAYWFTFSDGELSYVDNGGDGCYLLFGSEWYAVRNPSDPPLGE